MVRHLFQRTITVEGKKVKAWYYWYYDEKGRQVKKTCGKNKVPCLIKREAQKYIAELTKEDTDLKSNITLNEFCKNIFDKDSEYSKRLALKGRAIKNKTRLQKQGALKIILQHLGHIKVVDLSPVDIDKFLIPLPLENSTKNIYIGIIKELYEEMFYQKLISYIPPIKRFKNKPYSTKGILTKQEIAHLFPDSEEEIKKVWNIENDLYFVYPAMFYLILSTGLRIGEALAIQENQFIEKNILLLNASISEEKRVNYLKKGNEENPKWRVVIVPEKALKLIEIYKSKVPYKFFKDDYLFEFKGNPLNYSPSLSNFKKVLAFNDINYKKRNISIHSLRYTYDSFTKKAVGIDDLQLMLGHTTPQMTEYYDKSKAIDHLDDLKKHTKTINNIWK